MRFRFEVRDVENTRADDWSKDHMPKRWRWRDVRGEEVRERAVNEREKYEKFSQRYYTDAAWGKRGVTWPTEDASEFAADPVTEEDMAASTTTRSQIDTLLALVARVRSGDLEIREINRYRKAGWENEDVYEITVVAGRGFAGDDEAMFGKPQQPKESKTAEPFGSRDLDID